MSPTNLCSTSSRGLCSSAHNILLTSKWPSLRWAKLPVIWGYVFLTTTAVCHGNDHNYYTISKSRFGSISLLAEVTLGREPDVWSETRIVSLRGWGHLSADQCVSPRKIKKMPIRVKGVLEAYKGCCYTWIENLASTQEVTLHALSKTNYRKNFEGLYGESYQGCELWEQILETMKEVEIRTVEKYTNNT